MSGRGGGGGGRGGDRERGDALRSGSLVPADNSATSNERRNSNSSEHRLRSRQTHHAGSAKGVRMFVRLQQIHDNKLKSHFSGVGDLTNQHFVRLKEADRLALVDSETRKTQWECASDYYVDIT